MIFLDTNVVSETLKREPEPRVLRWLTEHDAELALSTVAIAEMAFGIARIRPDQRAARLGEGLEQWRRRLAGRIFAFNEAAALHYGEIMGAATHRGRPLSMADGMIAAIAWTHRAPLATRNLTDFREIGIALVDPWKN